MTPQPRTQLGRDARAELLDALEGLRDFGYQPTYNGRPSCPFCENFIDEDETHVRSCLLLRLDELERKQP